MLGVDWNPEWGFGVTWSLFVSVICGLVAILMISSPKACSFSSPHRYHSAAVLMWCHASVAILCVSVAFDLLVIFPILAIVCYTFGGVAGFRRGCDQLINWSTYITYNMPMIWSGSTFYINNLELAKKCADNNALLLANHASRIDWVIGLFIGQNVANNRRVTFVCEGTLAIMPLIGWYRKLVCEDIFVFRSFKQDKANIEHNIDSFRASGCNRMLFLAPEGVIVDFSERDMKYVADCEDFCRTLGMEPFEYVLTPRYKGLQCFHKHTHAIENTSVGQGVILDVTLMYVRAGKLLSCKFSDPERVVVDLYDLLAGMGGEPIDVYMCVEEMPQFSENDDIKSLMMETYKKKDKQIADIDAYFKGNQIEQLHKDYGFEAIPTENPMRNVAQVMHMVLPLCLCLCLGCAHVFLWGCLGMLLVVALLHTVGTLIGGTSTESVPFETIIKQFLMFIMGTTGANSHKVAEKKAAGAAASEGLAATAN